MSEILVKEARIQLRDELIEIFIKKFIMRIPIGGGIKINKTNLIKLLKKDLQFKLKYELYVKQFKSEDEAQFHIKHHTDIEDYLCPICGNIRVFYKKGKNFIKYYLNDFPEEKIKILIGGEMDQFFQL